MTLSRSTILSLSGWSNTQFSYWARRSEAISVLAPHDTRLRTVAIALERRLHAAGLFENDSRPSTPASTHSHGLGSTSPAGATQGHAHDYDALARELGMDPDDWVRTYVTGKGLDVIIDEVKKRSGVSPFLRGKHSSLDPFGAQGGDGDDGSGSGTGSVAGHGGSSANGANGRANGGQGAGAGSGSGSGQGGQARRAPVYMPTFQAEKYVHEVPEMDPRASASVRANGMAGMVSASAARAGKRKAVGPPPMEESVEEAWASGARPAAGAGASVSGSEGSVEESTARLAVSRTQSVSPPVMLYPEETFLAQQQQQQQQMPIARGMSNGTSVSGGSMPPSPVDSQGQYVGEMDASYAHAQPYSQPHPHPQTHPQPHPHPHPHSQAYPHPLPQPLSHPPQYQHPHPQPYQHPQAQPHPHPLPHALPHAQHHPHPHPHAHAQPQPLSLADPSSFARSAGGKKRRLAPAPPSGHVPGVPVLEPPRLYSNHLETG